MNFDKACEKIENTSDIYIIKNIIKNTNKQDRDAVTDMAKSRGWNV